MGRPQSNDELLQLIKQSTKVKAAGVGHSWWMEQACSGNTSDAVQVVLTEYPAVLALSQRLKQTYRPLDRQDPAAQLIYVDESALTVSVAGGVGLRVLMDWLAAYKTSTSPTGYVILAAPQYIDQTVAGAIATGTHGSTLVDGSLSSQINSLDLALANGTMLTITPQSQPHLWKAAQVSIGRLGVITSVVFRIRKNQPVIRNLLMTNLAGLADKLVGIQNAYNAATTDADRAAAVAPLNLQQTTWYIRHNHLWEITYRPLTNESSSEYQTAMQKLTQVSSVKSAASQAVSTDAAVTSAYALTIEKAVASKIDADTAGSNPKGIFNQVKDAVKLKPDIGFDIIAAANATEPIAEGVFYATVDRPAVELARDAYVTANEAMSIAYSGQMPVGNAHAQYELAIPMSSVGDCFTKINQYVYIDKMINTTAFTYFSQIRVVNEETAYISPTNGGPRVFLNIEDHNSFNDPRGPTFNTDLHKLIAFVNETCSPRLHWAKAGWPRYLSCFDGSVAYPQTWCDFGCAVQDLDPTGKFSSVANVWSFNAANVSTGAGVPFSSCCNAQGFDKARCTCARRTDCTAGPAKACTAEC
ncbi:g8581 [Coccomyxa viridis]|uniref:G8581 protein n=1 Tax=Coccomyxa viridis TaxID=1274662 RepID=A0ABP1G5I2_9CHLO